MLLLFSAACLARSYFSCHKTHADSFTVDAKFFGRLVGRNVGMSDCVVGLAAVSDETVGVVAVDADAVEVDAAVAADVALASDAPFPTAAEN